MNDGNPNTLKSSPDPIGVRLLVLLVALAGFAYLLYRLLQSYGQWPEEDVWSPRLRVVELVLVGVFALGALGYVLWPTFFAKEIVNDPGKGA